ncbi:MAG TPA: GAF domain-containing protein, partial [Vicinamibacterales bacterium]|nr:GAF domain-containing protein [Vicinamibacterales bacterium]
TRCASRAQIYSEVLPQLEALMGADEIANFANAAAVLKQVFGFFWVGFYRTTGPKLLTVGPYQGDLACVEIPFDKGVCGAAARTQKTIIVPDVEKFPGHIACSNRSRSEIVVPFVANGETRFVLDIDSDKLADFDETDRVHLERLVEMIGRRAG